MVGWSCKPIKPTENDGVPLQYRVRFERDDPTPTVEIFKHPNAEDFDDYREYKRSIREQRDAEKAGAEILHTRHKSNEGYFSRAKTMADRDDRVQSKAANYMYNNGAIDLSLEEVKARSGTPDERNDGLGQLFKRSDTVKPNRKSTSHSHSYDGSVDEPNNGIDSRLQEAMSSGRDDNSTPSPSHPDNASNDENRTNDPTPVTLTVPNPWDGLFTAIDWNAGRTGTRSRRLIEDSKVSGSIDPAAVLPYTTAEARGAFELARARKPLPANAPAFLAAMERVFHDLAMPDYVAKRVVRVVDV